jgi:hypothetical protein
MSIVVSTNADSGAGSLRDAISQANLSPGSTITFTTTGIITITSGTMLITANVTIQGPGAAVVNVQSTNSFNIFTVGANGITINISGLTISNGSRGINNSRTSTLNITNCTFTGNTATDGAAIASGVNSTLNVTGCTFTNNSITTTTGGAISSFGPCTISSSQFQSNTATGTGGGAVFVSGASTITNCTFTSNTATRGGGLYGNSAVIGVNGCTFTTNSASIQGGGSFNANATMTFTSCTFDTNSATGALGVGGGVYSAGTSTFNSCTFTSNSANGIGANGGGGGLFHGGLGATVTNCTFTGNTVPSANGGGIWNNGSSSLTISNTTLQNNSALNGGGLQSNLSIIHLFNSTFANNTVTNQGGGVVIASGTQHVAINNTFNGNSASQGGAITLSGSTISFINSTVSNNTSTGVNGSFQLTGGAVLNIGNTVVAVNPIGIIPDFNVAASTINSLSHNFIGNATGTTAFTQTGDQTGTTLAPINPLLLPLANYGGPTETMKPSNVSPLLNAGSNAIVTVYYIYPQVLSLGQPIDQRGFARIVFGTVDIGSVEIESIVCFSGDSVVMTKNSINGQICDILAKDVVSDIHQVFCMKSNEFVPVKLNVVTGLANRFMKLAKNSLGCNQPNRDFFVTSGHKLLINGNEVKARNIPEAIVARKKLQEVYTICTEKETPIFINGLAVMTWSEDKFLAYAKEKNMRWHNNKITTTPLQNISNC